MGAKEHAWRDIAVLADQWQEVLSSARAHHAAGTLFRTKDTVVTVEADEEDVSLLEEEGEDDDNQEEFPPPSVQAAPEPAGPSRPASVPDKLSRLMAIKSVYGNGSDLKKL